MNPTTIYAMLSIIASAGKAGITAREFAQRVWPDSRCWRERERRPYMSTAGGAAIGRLRRMGYVLTAGHGRFARHALSAEGTAFLRDFTVEQWSTSH